MTHAPAPDFFEVIKARQRVPLDRFEVRVQITESRVARAACSTKSETRRWRRILAWAFDLPATVHDVWADKEITV